MISKVSRLSIILFLSLINQSSQFIISKNYPITFVNRCKICERISNVIMNYDKFKDCKERLNLIPSFHATIITNNWINYIQEKNIQKNIQENINDNNTLNDFRYEEYSNYNKHYSNGNNKDDTEYPLNYLIKSLFDFKVFISINKNLNNMMIFAWIPNNHLLEKTIAYLVVGKIENNVLEIYRFIQNPYYDRDFTIKSIELKNDIDKIIQIIPNVKSTNYTNLHNYDKRYYISWSLNDR